MTTDLAVGLSDAEVARRRAAGEGNVRPDPTGRTVAQIVRANVVTLFNVLLGSLAVLMLVVGPWQDALFGLTVVANTGIGIVQELRARRTLARLSLLARNDIRVRRGGAERAVPADELVRGDVVLLATGDTVPVDGTVLSADGLEIDESLLTGETDPVAKQPDAEVLSGSFAVAGSGAYLATKVGADAYAARLAAEAGRFRLTDSELRLGINRLLRIIVWLLVPIGLLLVVSQLLAHTGFRGAVSGSVAGVVTMVPEGLVLLTSVAFAVGVIRLGRRRCLVQELAAIEGLARVDVVCLDKTGTLTDPAMRLGEIRPYGLAPERAAEVLGALSRAEPRPNPSTRAIAAGTGDPGWRATDTVPFSSARKYSGADFGTAGRFLLGAPEILLAADDPARVDADGLAGAGSRVLAVVPAVAGLAAPDDGHRAVALVVLAQAIRPEARATLAYFAAQGVGIRVISGDNPATVGAIAGRLGVPGADEPVDARTLPADPAVLADTLSARTCFGRTTPHQKRDFVGALHARRHVVAMTGDGVNDVLALSDADIGVAMGSGSEAAKSVAQVVLLDDSFATLPHVVAEGRRVLANIERVASLFLTKTCYAMLLAVLVGIAGLPFPFLPRHLTLIGALTIGIPSFLLALAPNTRRARPGFVPRVLRFAVPAGVVAAGCSFAAYALARTDDGTDLTADRTSAALALFVVTLGALAFVARPLRGWRLALVATMGGLFVLTLAVPAGRTFFALSPVSTVGDVAGVAIGAAGLVVLAGLLRLTHGWPSAAQTVR
ncbi:HAD-IC family P-type ATPase [Actinocatenispora rupis]|uniref:Magnesium-transporting ATPase n=1 Tax=Actinocatenispora rupis TaxID=519421 RepID=A0A8J3J633_9ACTN|nr:HAD-IC family P-type ATPase [Actinocatenispora rupis]GID09258.1 magnesium-transporting ATPase [Actinocatenispora rupis]